MSQSVAVFLNGTASVFLGMVILYVTIRVSAFAVGRWGPREEPKRAQRFPRWCGSWSRPAGSAQSPGSWW